VPPALVFDAQVADNLQRARAQARQQHLNTRVELLERQRSAIGELDTMSQRMMSDAKELYA
jgi:hypothetical protein